MAVKSDVKTGHDIAYVTRGHASGCAGAMAYYTRTGDPPGTWEGRGCAALGVSGTVEAEVAERLYQQGIGPGGERIIQHAAPKSDEDQAAAEAAAIARYREEHPFASASEINAERTRIRATSPGISRPYYDVTSSASKSVSVLHASLRVAAGQARQAGDDVTAAALDGEAQAIEDALLDSMREGLELLEAMACYIRTGHHSKDTGEWRDGKGLVATSWLHTISRDGDPQLHVHLAVLNAVQRADGVDDQWRAADGQHFYQLRHLYGVTVDRAFEQRLLDMGYAMTERSDGNGAEVGGVSQQVMDRFSSRARAIDGRLRTWVDQYTARHGKPPSRRTIYLMGQEIAKEGLLRQPGPRPDPAPPGPQGREGSPVLPELAAAAGGGDHLDAEEPARPRTPRRTRPRRPMGPRPPAAAGPQRLHLAQLADRSTGQALPDRLRPLSCPYLPVNDLEVAAAIAAGLADAGIASEPAALAYDLAFLPLTAEHFDLAIPAGHESTREVQGLLKVLSSAWLLDQLASLPGYDPARCGQHIATLPPRPQRVPRKLARHSGQPRPDHRK